MYTGAKNDFYTIDTQHQRRRLSVESRFKKIQRSRTSELG